MEIKDAMERKRSFIFHLDWVDTLDICCDINEKHEVYNAIFEYAETGKDVEMSDNAKMAFEFIKNQMDYDIEQYEATVKANNEKIEKQKQNNNNAITKITNDNKNNLYDNDIENVNDIDIDFCLSRENEKNAAYAATPKTMVENDYSHNENHSSIQSLASPKKEKSCAKKEKSLEERETEFRQKVKDIAQKQPMTYTQEMINDFCDYWTEHNESNSKLRYDKEKFFDIERRLKRWLDNKEKWRAPNRQNKPIAKAENLSIDDIWKEHSF